MALSTKLYLLRDSNQLPGIEILNGPILIFKIVIPNLLAMVLPPSRSLLGVPRLHRYPNAAKDASTSWPEPAPRGGARIFVAGRNLAFLKTLRKSTRTHNYRQPAARMHSKKNVVSTSWFTYGGWTNQKGLNLDTFLAWCSKMPVTSHISVLFNRGFHIKLHFAPSSWGALRGSKTALQLLALHLFFHLWSSCRLYQPCRPPESSDESIIYTPKNQYWTQ